MIPSSSRLLRPDRSRVNRLARRTHRGHRVPRALPSPMIEFACAGASMQRLCQCDPEPSNLHDTSMAAETWARADCAESSARPRAALQVPSVARAAPRGSNRASAGSHPPRARSHHFVQPKPCALRTGGPRTCRKAAGQVTPAWHMLRERCVRGASPHARRCSSNRSRETW
jgi:hypothetical protein